MRWVKKQQKINYSARPLGDGGAGGENILGVGGEDFFSFFFSLLVSSVQHHHSTPGGRGGLFFVLVSSAQHPWWEARTFFLLLLFLLVSSAQHPLVPKKFPGACIPLWHGTKDTYLLKRKIWDKKGRKKERNKIIFKLEIIQGYHLLQII